LAPLMGTATRRDPVKTLQPMSPRITR